MKNRHMFADDLGSVRETMIIGENERNSTIFLVFGFVNQEILTVRNATFLNGSVNIVLGITTFLKMDG